MTGTPGSFGDYPAAPPPSPEYASASASVGPQLAGWWYRVGATLIDGIITSVIGGVIGIAVSNTAGKYTIDAIIGVIYTVLLLGRAAGQTVGNLALGTRVIGVDGVPIGYGKAFLRWLVLTVLSITIIGGLLDIFWPLWDSKNQTLHDKAVNSLVVKTR